MNRDRKTRPRNSAWETAERNRGERDYSHRHTTSCGRKLTYPSKHLARQAERAMRKEYPAYEFDSYRCRACGLWHVGTVPNGGKK